MRLPPRRHSYSPVYIILRSSTSEIPRRKNHGGHNPPAATSIHYHSSLPPFECLRTNFVLTTMPQEKGLCMDSEKYHVRVSENGDGIALYIMVRDRLKDYWMTDDEIKLLSTKAFDFAKEMSADPQHGSLRLIPVAVALDVCTVRQEGEPFEACFDRAIRAQDLVQLYLCPFFTAVECKPMTGYLRAFLTTLPRVRVEHIEKGLALTDVCPVCRKNSKVRA